MWSSSRYHWVAPWNMACEMGLTISMGSRRRKAPRSPKAPAQTTGPGTAQSNWTQASAYLAPSLATFHTCKPFRPCRAGTRCQIGTQTHHRASCREALAASAEGHLSSCVMPISDRQSCWAAAWGQSPGWTQTGRATGQQRLSVSMVSNPSCSGLPLAHDPSHGCPKP